MVAAWLGAWVLSYVAGRICDNTCANHVNNSVCGDWTGSCPFGSDCGDCGVREYSIGTSEDLGTPAFVVCKANPDHRILESARFLAGAAAYPHSGLVQTPACVPFNCFDLEAPGCAGSCAELASHGPLCVPMARTDKAMSYSLDEYKISFARTKFDNNIGLFTDYWYPETCGKYIANSSTPWKERYPSAVFRGFTGVDAGYGAPVNARQEATGMLAIKTSRKAVNTIYNGSSLVNVTDEDTSGNGGKGATPEYQMLHRCIIYLEGQDVGSSGYWLMGSNSLILAPEVLTSENPVNLRPGVNYYPFHNNLSNLEDVVRQQCTPNAPTPEAAQIIHNAQQSFMDFCDMEREAQRKFQVLKMITKNVKKPFAAPVPSTSSPDVSPDPSPSPIPSWTESADQTKLGLLTAMECPKDSTLQCGSYAGEVNGQRVPCDDKFDCESYNGKSGCKDANVMHLYNGDGDYMLSRVCDLTLGFY